MFVSGVAQVRVRRNGLSLVCLLFVACGAAEDQAPAPDAPAPAYVGAAACGACHEDQFTAWRESHHALAMQPATGDTVLGDFSASDFRHFETTSSFDERDGIFYVRTEDADGELKDFPVRYTFGVTPLQQYLVEFPGGRLQTLPIAWDSRAEEEGGQRWFHIYADEPIERGDILHWTGREQNWNYMCAECHSTNVEKNYRVDDDSFETGWSEINVSCEACHGPGSVHVTQAEADAFASRFGLLTGLDDAGRSVWLMNPDTGIAARSELRMRPPVQPEACGRCHARRSVASIDMHLIVHSSIRICRRCWMKVFTSQMVRFARKSMSMVLSCRVACTRPASRAATATNPMRRPCVRERTRATCVQPVTCRRGSMPPNITNTRRHRLPASTVTCRPATTWSWTAAAITAFACHDRT